MKLAIYVCSLVLLISCKSKSDPVPSALYFPKVKTIISTNCLSCHSSSGTWSGRPVKLDTDDDIVAAAHAIKAAVADPISVTNHRMPQGGSLSQTDINTIVSWYTAGGLATN